MSTDILLKDVRDGICTLTLNRPERRNALSYALIERLRAELEEIRYDPAVRVVILAAKGPAFSAGHDLRELVEDRSRTAYERLFEQCSEMMQLIVHLPQPVIAQCHGIATAAGCQLVASCDLAVAGAGTRFATPGVNIGLFCTTPGVAVSRTVSRKHAMEMLLTGEMISAERAREIGLINTVVPDEELAAETWSLAEKIAAKSAMTVAMGKDAFYRQLEMDLAGAYRYASEVMTRNMLTHDVVEGISAFLEKRRPEWKDE